MSGHAHQLPPGDAHGPGGPPGGLVAAGAPPPPPRPVIYFTTNLRSPHHAGCEESTFTKHTCTIYRDGARHPRHLNARVGVLLLLK